MGIRVPRTELNCAVTAPGVLVAIGFYFLISSEFFTSPESLLLPVPKI